MSLTIPAAETLSPVDGSPPLAAAVKDGTEDERGCPDCGAKPGRSCYPDCLRFAEGV